MKQAAYTVERTVRRGLNEMELSATPEPACSMEVHASMEQTERPARTKKGVTAAAGMSRLFSESFQTGNGFRYGGVVVLR